MNLQLFRKHSLTSLARDLELTPFDLVRYIGLNGGLKSDLSFAKDETQKFYEDMDLESWWDSAGEMSAIIQAYSEISDVNQRRFQQVCAMLLKKSGCNRVDNLSRGFSKVLSNQERQLEKTRVTVIILYLTQQDVLHVRTTSMGFAVDIAQTDVLERIASGNVDGYQEFISLLDTYEA